MKKKGAENERPRVELASNYADEAAPQAPPDHGRGVWPDEVGRRQLDELPGRLIEGAEGFHRKSLDTLPVSLAIAVEEPDFVAYPAAGPRPIDLCMPPLFPGTPQGNDNRNHHRIYYMQHLFMFGKGENFDVDIRVHTQ
eukprot:CAMPEP_0174891498 /NCGR_PEP_ID=MMETSP0167-20121228/6563_1 /TAXON_ID=38298 /ORGANISM="Rhodella maculata, Strain CCMP736" /LENGTH=138 /DNA_ID=CAMNT_0016129699 /DNA_START=1277 /DNA_END=1693 /DNA_ORIENTATION=+